MPTYCATVILSNRFPRVGRSGMWPIWSITTILRIFMGISYHSTCGIWPVVMWSIIICLNLTSRMAYDQYYFGILPWTIWIGRCSLGWDWSVPLSHFNRGSLGCFLWCLCVTVVTPSVRLHRQIIWRCPNGSTPENFRLFPLFWSIAVTIESSISLLRRSGIVNVYWVPRKHRWTLRIIVLPLCRWAKWIHTHR